MRHLTDKSFFLLFLLDDGFLLEYNALKPRKKGNFSMMLRTIAQRYRNSDIGKLYNFRDEKSRGRVWILMHSLLDFMASTLATGIFYTSFLTINGIDIVSAGILTFVPYIAQLVTVISPYILERLPKRRWFLALCRASYFLLFILGTTVLPEVVSDPDLRLTCFVGLVLAANVINSLGGQGYTVWHAQFLPGELRSRYFTFNAIVINFGGSLVAIVSALVADALTGTAYEETVIVAIRYLAFGLSLLDIVSLLLPKEYPYKQAEQKQKISNVLTVPLRHKKFRNTMWVCFAYTFLQNITAGVLSYHMLNTVRISYVLPNIINLSYVLFLLVLFPYWCRKLERIGWVKVFNLGNLLDIPAILALAFVTAENVVWLYTLLRLFQHYLGVGRNTAYSNFLYMNLPPEGQTNYATFFSLGTTVFAFLGVSFGTGFVAMMGDTMVTVLGHSFNAVTMLVLLQAAASGLLAVFTRVMEPKIRPER